MTLGTTPPAERFVPATQSLRHMSAARRVLTTISALLLAVAFLGGCSSVPARVRPGSGRPRGLPQKTITELRTQTVDLLSDATTATGARNWMALRRCATPSSLGR